MGNTRNITYCNKVHEQNSLEVMKHWPNLRNKNLGGHNKWIILRNYVTHSTQYQSWCRIYKYSTLYLKVRLSDKHQDYNKKLKLAKMDARLVVYVELKW